MTLGISAKPWPRLDRANEPADREQKMAWICSALAVLPTKHCWDLKERSSLGTFPAGVWEGRNSFLGWGGVKGVLIWETRALSDQHLAYKIKNRTSLGGVLCPAAGTTACSSAPLLCFPLCSWLKSPVSLAILRKVCSGPCY